GGARERSGDRFARYLIGAGNATARLHDQQWLVAQPWSKRLIDTLEIASHGRFDEGVDQRRHRALVFSIFGEDLARPRECARGGFSWARVGGPRRQWAGLGGE